MKFFFELVFFAFLYLLIYRRIVEPFIEGYRQRRKPYNEQPPISHKKKSEEIVDRLPNKEIIDAEFEEIK